MQTVVRAEYVPAEACVATYLVTCDIRATATNRTPANYSGVVFKNLFGQLVSAGRFFRQFGTVRYVTVRYGS